MPDGKAVLDLVVRDTNAMAQCRAIAVKKDRLLSSWPAKANSSCSMRKPATRRRSLAICRRHGRLRVPCRRQVVARGGHDLLLIDLDNGTRTPLATGLDAPQAWPRTNRAAST